MHKSPVKTGDYSFSDGIIGMEQYNLNAISRDDERAFGEVLGFLLDIKKEKNDRKAIESSPWIDAQIEFFENRLKRDVDFSYNKTRDHRYTLTVKNPIIAYYCRNDFPSIGTSMENHILRGLLSSSSLRTILKRGKKIIHIGRGEKKINEIRCFADLKKLHFASMDYPTSFATSINVNTAYSCWFYDSIEASAYITEDIPITEDVRKLPNFNSLEGNWIVTQSQILLRRKVNYLAMRREGKLTVNEMAEKQKEFQQLKKHLSNATRLLAEGKLDPMEAEKSWRRYEDLSQALSKKPEYAGSGAWKRRRDWKDFKTRERY